MFFTFFEVVLPELKALVKLKRLFFRGVEEAMTAIVGVMKFATTLQTRFALHRSK